jgi:hypothetical protein
VISRFELEPVGSRPEATGRRSITFSPAGGATVILRGRRPRAGEPEATEPLAATA